jgi:hypothetical protein
VETDPTEADRGAIVAGMVSGQYSWPLKVIAVQPDGTWRDVSFEIAAEVDRTVEREGQTLTEGTQAFVMAHPNRPAPPTNDLVTMMNEFARGVGNIR